MTNLDSLSYFIPELVLTVTVLLVIMADIIFGERKEYDYTGAIALLGTAVAFYTHFDLYSKSATPLFEGMIAHDMFSLFFRGFFIFCTAIIVLISIFCKEVTNLKKSEYHAILLSICVGMCLVSSGRDLIMIYLAMELMSIGSYILAGFARGIGRSEEASLKYVLYGGFSSGVVLFGLSLLYGLTGSTHFDVIQSTLVA